MKIPGSAPSAGTFRQARNTHANLGSDQLDTQLLYFTIRLLWSSTCFKHYMLIIRKMNCIDAASDIVTLSKWLFGAQLREFSLRLSIILGNGQLDTQLLYFTIRLLWSSTCFEHYVLIIRRMNYIDAASGIVTLSKWLSGTQVERELQSSSLSTYAPDSHLLRVTIPDAASIQFILLMMST